MSLAIEGIIDTHPDTAAEDRGRTSDFTLTAKGLEVIQDCARWQEQEGPKIPKRVPVPRRRAVRRDPPRDPPRPRQAPTEQTPQQEVEAALHGFADN